MIGTHGTYHWCGFILQVKVFQDTKRIGESSHNLLYLPLAVCGQIFANSYSILGYLLLVTMDCNLSFNIYWFSMEYSCNLAAKRKHFRWIKMYHSPWTRVCKSVTQLRAPCSPLTGGLLFQTPYRTLVKHTMVLCSMFETHIWAKWPIWLILYIEFPSPLAFSSLSTKLPHFCFYWVGITTRLHLFHFFLVKSTPSSIVVQIYLFFHSTAESLCCWFLHDSKFFLLHMIRGFFVLIIWNVKECMLVLKARAVASACITYM